MASAHCPVCKSPLGSWEVRPLFGCHHCRWALRANVGDAFRRALVVGVLTECLLLLGLRLWFGSWLDILDVWFGMGAGLGVLAGEVVYSHSLVVTPLRPQKHLRANA